MAADIRVMACYIVIGVIMLYVFYTDWKQRVIYNTAIVLMLVCAVFMNIDNMDKMIHGLVISFVYFIPFWFIKGIGGGDFKLLVALGASVGIINNFIIFLVAAIPCVIYVIIKSFMRSKEELTVLAGDIVFSCKMLSMGQLKTVVDMSRREKVPFGCWLCGSYYVYLIIGAFGGYI